MTGVGWRLELPGPAVSEVRQLRVAVWADDPACPVSPEVPAAVERAAAALADAGAAVDGQARPFDLGEAQEVAFALCVAASCERAGNEEMERLAELARSGAGSELTRRRAAAETMSHRDWLRLDSRRRRLQTGWTQLLERVDVLLCPAAPVPAVPHDPDPAAVPSVDHRLELSIDVGGRRRPYLDQIMWPVTVGMGGLPAAVAPAGPTPDGLPVGVQIVAGPGRDRTAIAAARLLAGVAGGFRRPPGFD